MKKKYAGQLDLYTTRIKEMEDEYNKEKIRLKKYEESLIFQYQLQKSPQFVDQTVAIIAENVLTVFDMLSRINTQLGEKEREWIDATMLLYDKLEDTLEWLKQLELHEQQQLEVLEEDLTGQENDLKEEEQILMAQKQLQDRLSQLEMDNRHIVDYFNHRKSEQQ
ncbi:hypothetical protein RFI_37247, partial [Reticulomyxa filosa]